MLSYPPPRFEQQKKEVLQRFQILNESDARITSQIAETAALALNVPIVIAALNERYRHWYRSTHGVAEDAYERLQMFCGLTHLSDDVFVVEDLKQDPYFSRFMDNFGTQNPVFMAGAPLRDPDGKRLGTFCILDNEPRTMCPEQLTLLENFAQLSSNDMCLRSAGRYAVHDLINAEQARCDLFDMAMTDPLTKSLNRRAFFRFSTRELQRAQRHNTPLSVLLIDIDLFKDVNDIYGHKVGDIVLQKLVQTITDSSRSEDLLGRLGGEEFVMLLPETDPQAAITAANRLREEINSLRFASHLGDFSISVSIGVSGPFPMDKKISPALERADAALYKAKNNGRDCVEIFWPDNVEWLPAASGN